MRGFKKNVVTKKYAMVIEYEANDGARAEEVITVEAESESAAMMMVPEGAIFIEFATKNTEN